MEQREDGSHETRLSENIRNLNRRNAYSVFDSHNRVSGSHRPSSANSSRELERPQHDEDQPGYDVNHRKRGEPRKLSIERRDSESSDGARKSGENQDSSRDDRHADQHQDECR